MKETYPVQAFIMLASSSGLHSHLNKWAIKKKIAQPATEVSTSFTRHNKSSKPSLKRQRLPLAGLQIRMEQPSSWAADLIFFCISAVEIWESSNPLYGWTAVSRLSATVAPAALAFKTQFSQQLYGLTYILIRISTALPFLIFSISSFCSKGFFKWMSAFLGVTLS